MLLTRAMLPPGTIVYPESDGKPMADNTKQARWIVILFDNLCALFAHLTDVFIAADHFWYPVEGEPEIRQAPDVFVVVGRPKGDRSSYRQWEEGGVPVTVAFEVMSPGNTPKEMADKQLFYEEYGVEEYYIYDPDNNYLQVFVRKGEVLRRVPEVDGFVSPRLGIRFQTSGPEMVIYRPDGQPFITFEQLMAERVREQQRADQAEQRVGQAEQRASQAEQRAARLAELALKVQTGQATPDDLRELQQLAARPTSPLA